MSEQARLKWLCRRGMKELDVLLEQYLARDYAGTSVAEQAAFRELLELQDPVLWDYVMERDRPQDEVMQNVIRKLVSTLHA